MAPKQHWTETGTSTAVNVSTQTDCSTDESTNRLIDETDRLNRRVDQLTAECELMKHELDTGQLALVSNPLMSIKQSSAYVSGEPMPVSNAVFYDLALQINVTLQRFLYVYEMCWRSIWTKDV